MILWWGEPWCLLLWLSLFSFFSSSIKINPFFFSLSLSPSFLSVCSSNWLMELVYENPESHENSSGSFWFLFALLLIRFDHTLSQIFLFLRSVLVRFFSSCPSPSSACWRRSRRLAALTWWPPGCSRGRRARERWVLNVLNKQFYKILRVRLCNLRNQG